MSTEIRLARLGLLHLVDDTEALKATLKEKATLLRSNPKLHPSDIATTLTINNSFIRPSNKPPERD